MLFTSLRASLDASLDTILADLEAGLPPLFRSPVRDAD